MSLARPTDAQPHYGEHLGDATYWAPYVLEVLDRHALPTGAVETPFVGTFPTFLVGDLVVKLFGTAFDGEASSRTEIAMHALLASEPDIPAPAAVASGAGAGLSRRRRGGDGPRARRHHRRPFVDDDRLTALIDWGDALVAERIDLARITALDELADRLFAVIHPR